MTEYILANNRGATATTTLLVCHDLLIQERQTPDFKSYFLKLYWAEHDPDKIFSTRGYSVIT